MKRAGGSGGGAGGVGGGIIDLTGESSQDSDHEPGQKKARCEEKSGKGGSGKKTNQAGGQDGGSGAGPSSRQEGRKKEWKARGFTPANGFHVKQPVGGGGWGGKNNGGGKHRVAGQRRKEVNSIVAQARPPPLMMGAGGGGGSDWGGGVFPSDDVFSHPSDSFRVQLCPDPDNFTQVVDSLSCPVDMQVAVAGAGRYSCLTRDIVRSFNNQQQDKATMMQKILLWKEIYRAVRSEIDCGIFVFGSTFNGFGGSGCDIDMCLFPQGYSVGDKQWLTMVRRLLQQHCRHFIRGGIELINAKVPILKFFDREGRLEVDLSVNNPTSIRNTHLLYCYSQSDYRVRPLVLAVKIWAKDHKINEARFQTLSSYTLTLMVLHYLQCGVSPPVVPCLHKSHPQMFNPKSDIFSLPYSAPPFTSSNTMSLGELLVGFFSYYSTSFNPRHDVGSVRCGSVLAARDCESFARLQKLSPGQWRARLLMEEPFDRTNAARAVCSDQKWDLVRQTFEATNARIERANIAGLTLEHLSSKKIVFC